MTIEKQICEVYVLRNNGNQVQITLTSGRPNEVTLSLTGSFGTYAHYFGACGDHYLKFLSGLKNNRHYMQQKFGIRDVIDEAATIALWRAKAIEEYEDGSPDLKYFLSCLDDNPDITLALPPRQAYDLFDGSPDVISNPPGNWNMLWNEFLMPFFEKCGEEYQLLVAKSTTP